MVGQNIVILHWHDIEEKKFLEKEDKKTEN